MFKLVDLVHEIHLKVGRRYQWRADVIRLPDANDVECHRSLCC